MAKINAGINLGIGRKKKKSVQYVVAGSVAVVILGMWVSLPLLNNSAMSSSVSAGNPFGSKVSDVSMLGSDIAAEGSAPGGALSGEMINNPATSGEDILSSLFQSGSEAEAAPVDASAEAAAAPYGADASASSPDSPASGGSGRPMGKLAATGSLGGSSGGSMTAGSTHGQFFGSGNQKAEVAPVSMNEAKKGLPSSDRKGAVTAMLNSAVSQGKLAVKTGNMDAAQGGAASAFTGGSKGATTSDLKAGDDENSSVSGIELGQAAGSLKKNDPNLNKTKVSMPKVTAAAEVKDPNEELKQMIIKMILNALLGSVFGSGVGSAVK